MDENRLTTIKPGGGLALIDLAEIWRYRELLYFLTWRDVKVRYKQTLIGVAWAVLQPVLSTAIFTLLFSSWVKFDTKDIPYPLFALCGLMLWLFNQNAVSIASSSFVNNANLVTKVYFPRLIVPLAAALAALFDLLFSLVILVGMMVVYGVVPGNNLFAAPLFMLMAFVTASAVGTMLSALNVRFRDVKFAVPFLLQVWMIASPVFYPASIVSEKWRLIFGVNPMTGVIEGFRSAIFNTEFDWQLIGVSAASMVVITVISLLVFDRLEDDFADVI